MNRWAIGSTDAYTSYGDIFDLDYVDNPSWSSDYGYGMPTGDPNRWLNNAICSYEWAMVDGEFQEIVVCYLYHTVYLLHRHTDTNPLDNYARFRRRGTWPSFTTLPMTQLTWRAFWT